MIRDPSDGTVRPIVQEAIDAAGKLGEARVEQSAERLGLTGPDTGLRQPTRTDAQERLEESRKWLKKYQQAVRDANSMNDKGEVTNARGNHGEEHSADRRSGDDQGQAESGIRHRP